MTETVNHPVYYNENKFECIEVMLDVFGKEAVLNFCLLNAFKYIWRADNKNGVEDIWKAAWYLEKYGQLKNEESK